MEKRDRKLYKRIAKLQSRLRDNVGSFDGDSDLKAALGDLAQHCMDVRIAMEIALDQQKEIELT